VVCGHVCAVTVVRSRCSHHGGFCLGGPIVVGKSTAFGSPNSAFTRVMSNVPGGSSIQMLFQQGRRRKNLLICGMLIAFSGGYVARHRHHHECYFFRPTNTPSCHGTLLPPSLHSQFAGAAHLFGLRCSVRHAWSHPRCGSPSQQPVRFAGFPFQSSLFMHTHWWSSFCTQTLTLA
jgi:hypothetical protein